MGGGGNEKEGGGSDRCYRVNKVKEEKANVLIFNGAIVCAGASQHFPIYFFDRLSHQKFFF